MKQFWIIVVTVAVILVFLSVVGYRQQVLNLLPYLLIGLCPLHMLLHVRHKHGKNKKEE